MGFEEGAEWGVLVVSVEFEEISDEALEDEEVDGNGEDEVIDEVREEDESEGMEVVIHCHV